VSEKINFKFDVVGDVVDAFYRLVASDSYYGLSRRQLVSILLLKEAARLKDPVPPKAQKLSPKESLMISKNDAYRATGKWPRTRLIGDGDVYTMDGVLMFIDPADPTKSFGGWAPPDDYPFMVEYLHAKAIADGIFLDPNKPKHRDYISAKGVFDSVAYAKAEREYVLRDATKVHPK